MSHGDKFYPIFVHNRNAPPKNQFIRVFYALSTAMSKHTKFYQLGVKRLLGQGVDVKKIVHINGHWDVQSLSTIVSLTPRFVLHVIFLGGLGLL